MYNYNKARGEIMKKKIIFGAYNLDIGGIETALVSLLNNLDYSKYEVYLFLVKKEGIVNHKYLSS